MPDSRTMPGKIYKMGLEYLSVLLESKEVTTNKQTLSTPNPPPHTMIEVCKGTQEPTERAPNGQSWDYVNNKINTIALDYNPKSKINIHECILILKMTKLINEKKK